jgi:hypothetical protein
MPLAVPASCSISAPPPLGPGTRVIEANEEIWRFLRGKRAPQTAAFDADQGGRLAAA